MMIQLHNYYNYYHSQLLLLFYIIIIRTYNIFYYILHYDSMLTKIQTYPELQPGRLEQVPDRLQSMEQR